MASLVYDSIAPHGGNLVDLRANPDRCAQLLSESKSWPSWDLTPRQLADLELLLNGGFSPLGGFMGRADYDSVCSTMRLKDGSLWPISVTLDVPEMIAQQLRPGSVLALRDPEKTLLAALHVQDLWTPDLEAESQTVYGTTNPDHPGVHHLLRNTHPHYVGGRLEGLRLPGHYDFPSLRRTPAELRNEFARLGWRRVVAFQTRNLIHRADFEICERVMRELAANVLLFPAVGINLQGDIDHYTRVRCYRAVLPYFPADSTRLALLPLAERTDGPRSALWQAIIAKNFGCTDCIVGGDHAGPGQSSNGEWFQDPDAGLELLREYESELGIGIVPFNTTAHVKGLKARVPEDRLSSGKRAASYPHADLLKCLAAGEEIPEWFTFPEVDRELRRRFPPRSRQGFTVFFTGLSASGKSTTANVLLNRILEIGGRSVTLLDGDLVRKHLSSELGFSKEHRDLNIRRIGYVASEITKSGGIAICAPIAPYDQTRKDARHLVEEFGGFILVHVATPLEICEQRDGKGQYAKARAGIVPHFTGISDPYERPSDAEVVIDASRLTPEEAADHILAFLQQQGYFSRTASKSSAASAQ